MTKDTTAEYLRDLGDLVKRSALDARVDRDSASAETDRVFLAGRLAAYHEIVSLMQQQAVVFGLELKDVALSDIDTERDLL